MIVSKFYDGVRSMFPSGRLTTKQVNGMAAIITHWQTYVFNTDPDLRKLAYVLATACHETATTMQPIEEYGKGKGKPYGKKLKHSGLPYATPNKIYYGRGFVQLTWYENYQLMGRLLGHDLLNFPELTLSLVIASQIMFEGMYRGSSSIGDFTGKCLEQYFNGKLEDPEGARKIINGTDKAKLIAGYYKIFLTALKSAS